MRRMIMKKNYHKQIISNFENFHFSQNIKNNSEKVVKNEKTEKNYQKADHFEIDTIISASKWAQLLSYGMNSSPHTYTFKLEILEPYRLLCATEPAIVAYTGTYLYSVYFIHIVDLILFCTYAFLAGSVRMRIILFLALFFSYIQVKIIIIIQVLILNISKMIQCRI